MKLRTVAIAVDLMIGRRAGVGNASRAQIALEFIIVYSLIIAVFIIFFALIAGQRAASLTQQAYGTMQLVAQGVASDIDQAVSAGSGFASTFALPAATQSLSYSLSISSTGVVIANTVVGRQVISAVAFSAAKGMQINGTLLPESANGINIYSVPTSNGSIRVYDSRNVVFVDETPVSTLAQASGISAEMVADVEVADFGPVTQALSGTLSSGDCATTASSNDGPVSISINPSKATIRAGQSVTFTNSTTGRAEQPFTYCYSVKPATGVSQSGNTFTFAVGGTFNVTISFLDGNKDTNASNSSIIKVTGGSSGSPTGSYVAVYGSPNAPANSTISAWVYPSSAVQDHEHVNLIAKGPGQPYLGLQSPNSIVAGIWGGNSTQPVPITLGTWSHVAASFARPGNTIILYINGLPQATATSPQGISANPQPELIGTTMPVLSNGTWFNGSIANVQLYNSTLTGNEVRHLFTGGLGSQPLNAASLSAWWPLDGNPNDYSGNGHDGTGYNISYSNAAQLALHVSNGSSMPARGDPIGLVAGPCVASGGPLPGPSAAFKTNESGNQTFFVSSSAASLSNLTATAFTGNLSLAGNLIGWWPMDLGYGDSLCDLSGGNNNAGFTYPSWGHALPNATSMFTALFDGANSMASGNLSLTAGNLTLLAWVNTTSTGNALPENVFGLNSTGGVDTLSIGIAAGGNAILAWTNKTGGKTYAASGGFVPSGTLHTLAGVWSGTSRKLSIYVDGNLDGTAAGPVAQSIALHGFDIGGAYGGAGFFAGTLSNVQVYREALSQQQLLSLYRSGMASAPLPGSELVGWWPLDGSASGFANASACACTNTSIAYLPVSYANPNALSKAIVATFDGADYATEPNAYKAPSALTMSMWIYPTAPTGQFEFPLNSSPGSPWRVGFNATGNLYFNPGVQASVGTIALANATIRFGTWQYIAVTSSGSGANVNYTAYLNGAPVATGTLLKSSIKHVNTLSIGGPTDPFVGQMADLEIYNASLTPTQALQAYEQGLPIVSRLNVSSMIEQR